MVRIVGKLQATDRKFTKIIKNLNYIYNWKATIKLLVNLLKYQEITFIIAKLQVTVRKFTKIYCKSQ